MVRECGICGEEFRIYPYLIKQGNGKYCSRKCYNEYRKGRNIRKCGVCSKEFKTYRSKIKDDRGKYCSRDCFYKSREGSRPSNYKGCIKIKNGKEGKTYYRKIHVPEHPNSDAGGRVMEHRLIIEKELGRYLKPHEIVHHIDGDGLNNAISNLQLMDKKEHMRIHENLNTKKKWQKKKLNHSLDTSKKY